MLVTSVTIKVFDCCVAPQFVGGVVCKCVCLYKNVEGKDTALLIFMRNLSHMVLNQYMCHVFICISN